MSENEFSNKKRKRKESSSEEKSLEEDSDNEKKQTKNLKKIKKNKSDSEEEEETVIKQPRQSIKAPEGKSEKLEKLKEKKTNSLEDDIIIGKDEIVIKLSDKKRVSIRKFMRNTLIDIREFYEKEGEYLPGKKGISLSLDLWDKLKKHMKNIDTAIENIK
jgi:hypothetical protein